MEAHQGLNPEDAGSTSALRELARRKFLEFLNTYSEADNDFSRSQESHESQQADPTQPTKIYIEQVCYKMPYKHASIGLLWPAANTAKIA